MNETQLVEQTLFKILQENPKIPLTLDGLKFVQNELVKILKPVEYEIKIQSLDEMSDADKAMRKLPKVSVVLK